MDLYKILGVSREAGSGVIKGAYRRRSKETHPDTGGTAEQFDQVKLAYDILSDPERRKRYDATGDVSGSTPDNSMGKIHSLIVGALDRAIQGDDLDHRNIVEIALKFLEHDKREGESANDNLRASKVKFEKIRKRLKFKGDGVDLVDRTFADRINDIDRNIAGNEQVMVQVATAIEGLRNGWSYETDARPVYPSWTTDDPRVFSSAMPHGLKRHGIFPTMDPDQ